MRDIFSIENRLARLTKMGDILIKLEEHVNWEMFRSLLDEIYYTEDNRAGGRKAYDRVMMFKILILQNLYNISDDNTEYQINDRLSFQRFLGLEIGDRVPDAKTIWDYKNKLVKSGRQKEVFNLYTAHLEEKGIITRKGSIVDATFVERPRQKQPKESSADNINPNRDRQIDTDARGAKKNNKNYYGYKNHINADADSKLITDFSVTPANRHDGAEAPAILSDKDKAVYMDACYRGKEKEGQIKTAAPNANIYIVRKHDGYNEPTAEQLEANKPIQKVRIRVEHIFGHMVKSMGGKQIRCCGIKRATTSVMLKNLTYNMCRSTFLFSRTTG